jgi:sulfite reductase (NADPH) hemoprotein beta-component
VGDTNYHPAEKHLVDSYGSPWTFCTPAKILKKVLDNCGAKEICDIGFGDDSEMGGFNAGYERWSDELWSVLATAGGDGGAAKKGAEEPAGPKNDPNEYIKLGSAALKQPLLNDLMDPTNDINVQGASAQISKHHGIYQQKLRDHDIITEEQKRNPFSFMVRVRLPGGDCTPAQMKGMLDICDELGNGTVKITTRQTFQLHGIQKRGLIESINQINKYAMDTIAACGDVNRNVMSTCVKYPTMDARDPNLARYERTVFQCNEVAKEVSIHLLPDGLCNSYHEIWVNRGRPNHADEQYKAKGKVYVKGNALKYRQDGTVDFEHEPVLKQRYLPRKFKMAISIPPFNDTDCFAHCIGLIAISDANGDVLGFNLSIGGGTSGHALSPPSRLRLVTSPWLFVFLRAQGSVRPGTA